MSISLTCRCMRAYGLIMAADEDIATAIEGPAHWRPEGTAGLYEPPGVTRPVRVQPVPRAVPRQARYAAIILRNGRAEHRRPCHTVTEAIRRAEGVRLD